jgi:hypothetical protein
MPTPSPSVRTRSLEPGSAPWEERLLPLNVSDVKRGRQGVSGLDAGAGFAVRAGEDEAFLRRSAANDETE